MRPELIKQLQTLMFLDISFLQNLKSILKEKQNDRETMKNHLAKKLIKDFLFKTCLTKGTLSKRSFQVCIQSTFKMST